MAGAIHSLLSPLISNFATAISNVITHAINAISIDIDIAINKFSHHKKTPTFSAGAALWALCLLDGECNQVNAPSGMHGS